ncbi:methyltransferase, FkbM family [Methylobacterium sp. 275MFSha3.1]|uniref:FkbM family methyltransferase n=1 Tax=Methylobacterium sp. 275MFSha3.1 TaxID=1502746 RepID=UPI0008A7767F|nr:FkbM family methyltransferase [Methylobacterium sp. 275MFSha3.1]SEI14500.1 methyltransferase, FkbM family [Methylobacterium sp. 275MFSha3.1]
METELLTTFMSLLGIREKLETRPHLYSDELSFLSFAAKHAAYSNSQVLQDLWVLYETGEKREGYFVEFGICDGRTLSNTLLLEKMFGWQGAVAEPGRIWHKKLYANRSCYISNKCIYKEGGLSLSFHETDVTELSTLDSFTDVDFQSSHRTGGARYDVETISLSDFLAAAKAPRNIDYMSVDIEGGEFDVLNSFDFSEYNIKLLSIEHNYSDKRQDIYDALSRWGYRRKFTNFSMFDDWYVKYGDAA